MFSKWPTQARKALRPVPLNWELEDGTIGARGEVTLLTQKLDPIMILEFTFRVQDEGKPKQENFKYFNFRRKKRRPLVVVRRQFRRFA